MSRDQQECFTCQLDDEVQGPLRIAIVTENFLPKIDGVTRTSKIASVDQKFDACFQEL